MIFVAKSFDMYIRISIGIITVLLLYAAFLYMRMLYFIHVGVGLANEAVAYEQVVDDASESVLFLGDSSAVGTGASDNSKTVAGYLGADNPDWSITNLAENGLKLNGLVSQMKKMDSRKYDLLVIQIGGNDIVRRTELDLVRRDLRIVLEESRRFSDRVIIFHGGNVGTSLLLPWPSRPYFTQRTLEVREIYFDVVADFEGVTYVDMFREKSEDPFYLEPSKHYAEDYFHPSGDGYLDWYMLIREELA